jgi:hypothetical protein
MFAVRLSFAELITLNPFPWLLLALLPVKSFELEFVIWNPSRRFPVALFRVIVELFESVRLIPFSELKPALLPVRFANTDPVISIPFQVL